MKYSQAIEQVRIMAGDINVLQFTDDDVLNWLNNAVRECALINNLLQVSASTTLTSGDNTEVLPTDILKLHSVKVNKRKIQVLTMQEFNEQYPNVDITANGDPQTCYVWAGTINFWPTPGTNLPLIIDYIKDPPNVLIANIASTDIPLPVGYHQRLIDYCLAQVAQQDDDMNRYQIKMQEFLTGVQSLKDQPEYTQDLYPHMSPASDDMPDYYGVGLW